MNDLRAALMKYPWMPLFWGDFLANTMHLSAQEAGAYLFLIAHAWEHNGTIPAEKVRLARIAHVRQDNWKKVWCALQPFFEIKAEGPLISGYTHQRVLDELRRLGKISNKRKEAILQRYNKRTTNDPTSTSTTNRDLLNGKRRKADDPNYRSPPAKKSDNVLVPLVAKGRGE